MTRMLSAKERFVLGQERRKQMPRLIHKTWKASARKMDPLKLLEASTRGRVPALVAMKNQLMAASPFGYFRGAVPVMAYDLSLAGNTGICNQLCGDAHVRNLGAFAAPDGRLVFDINDFDETTRGPFEWDTRRLAASLVLAGRQANTKNSGCRDAVRTFTASYRNAVRMFSQMPVLEAARYQVHRLQRIQPVSKALLQAERSTPLHTLDKLTEVAAGHPHRIFRTQPPELVRLTATKAREILAGLAEYRASLLPERRHFLDQYRPLDVAMKVVGTGSVGLRCYAIYLEGNGENDPLFLQLKEEVASAYAAYLPAPLHGAPHHNGERVAEGQRAMQFLSDPLLGWTTIAARQYEVRQLNDHKGAIDLSVLAGEGLAQYAEVCGELLARGHCRSGDACALAGYLGTSDKIDGAVTAFAEVYADQTEKDWQQLRRAKGYKPVRGK